MKNPPGLVKISTGGSASTTSVTIDGNPVMVSRAEIVIDPNNGENHIKLSCFSRQKNGTYEDGEMQTFYGISAENFEFMKGLFNKISMASDAELDEAIKWAMPMPSHIIELLRFIQESRKETT